MVDVGEDFVLVEMGMKRVAYDVLKDFGEYRRERHRSVVLRCMSVSLFEDRRDVSVLPVSIPESKDFWKRAATPGARDLAHVLRTRFGISSGLQALCG